MAGPIHVDQRMWPDREHYQLEVHPLGDDAHGRWIHAPRGTAVSGGRAELWSLPWGFVGLVPVDDWWVVSFYSDHPEITVYVDIATPAKRHGSHLSFVDLDLDVIRRLNDTVEVIDEDEFEENRVAFDYPDELVDGAREAADRAAGFMRDRAEPFGDAADQWLALVDAGLTIE